MRFEAWDLCLVSIVEILPSDAAHCVRLVDKTSTQQTAAFRKTRQWLSSPCDNVGISEHGGKKKSQCSFHRCKRRLFFFAGSVSVLPAWTLSKHAWETAATDASTQSLGRASGLLWSQTSGPGGCGRDPCKFDLLAPKEREREREDVFEGEKQVGFPPLSFACLHVTAKMQELD